MKDGKKENAVNYFNVTVWDNLAEIMSKYLKKEHE
ncbi:MAG: single-stranded DNA-binding protein [Bacteroidales bacterium]|nr:single-stranded DNA-binding protein [Bacteroidales bacterium]